MIGDSPTEAIQGDIKPGNVLVVDDEVKLLDFGIAIDSANVADMAGTIDYMAPEVLLGEAPGISADLYSVGVVFYQLLTDRFPNRSNSVTSILGNLLGESADATVSPQMAMMIDHLPQSARQLEPAATRNDLAQHLRDNTEYSTPSAGMYGEGQLILPDSVSEPLRPIVQQLLIANPHERYGSANIVLRALAATVPDELPMETVATRESFLQASVLIGREAELARLSKGLKSATLRSGSAILIGGESGVGKSRLLSELRTLALVHGCWVGDGQSVSEGGFLFQEWLPLIRELCFRVDMSDLEASVFKALIPDIQELLGREIPDPPTIKADAALARMATTLVSLLKRLTKPLVLIFEDLHWGRSESLELLTEVVNAAAELPIFILGTYRSDESPNLPKTLPAFQQLQLQRLQLQDIARLSESMLGPVGRQPQLVEYLDRQTEGNVFFVVEIVRALAQNAGELERIDHGELPENVLTVGIGRIVERRIDQVSTEYRPLLEFSATLGRRLDLLALQRVFPQASLRDFLLECANAAVLESQGSEWRFAHDKLRESILHRLVPGKLQQLHLQVAEILESLYTGKQREPFAAALGYHYKEAGVPERSVQYYREAGDSGIKVYAYEQARAYYAASIEQLDKLPETTEQGRMLVDLLTKQVQCSVHSTAPDVNLQRMARARERLESIQNSGAGVREDRLRMARLDYYCARLYNYASQPAQAVPFFRRALPVAHEFQDQELILISSVYLGFALAVQGQVNRAIALLEPVPAPMERLFGTDIETMRAHLYLATFLSAAGKYERSVQLIEHVQPWVDEIQQAVYSGLFYMFCGFVMLQGGEWPAALRVCEHALEICGKTKEPLVQYLSWDMIASAHSNLGNHEAALAARRQAVEIRRNYGGGTMKDWFDAAEAEILLRAGQSEAAQAQAQKVADTSRPTGFMLSLVVSERAWGCAAARLGAPAQEVDAHFQASCEAGLSVGLRMEVIRSQAAWGQVCRERGDSAAAEACFERVKALMTPDMSSYARAEFLRIIGSRTQPSADMAADPGLPS